MYIATLHAGYPDGPLITGRSMPSPATATRVAWANVNPPQRIDVPFTILTTKPGVRAAFQIQYIVPDDRPSRRETVPGGDVWREARRAATEPRLVQVP
jgi:hypothetical protein